MKIFYITNARIPTEKAHGVQIMKACEAFADTGCRVELVVPERATNIPGNPFDFYGVRRNFTITKVPCFDAFRFERFFGRFSFWLQSVSFLMHLRNVRPPLDALVYTRTAEVAQLFSKKGYRVAFEAHAWPESKQGFYQRLLRNINYIVCNSQGTETEFRKRGFQNTLVAPNGVDLSLFQASKDTATLKQQLGFPHDKKIVMYTGHLYAWKGADVILELTRHMSASPDVFFVLVGGTKSDVKKYSNSITKDRLENVVLCGHREQREIPNYLACADALLLPNIPVSTESERYTSPIKMFEYMASGKPIIASDLPSIREVLNEGNAILARAGDVSGFATGIKKALTDDVLVARITAQARADVQNYTWEKRAHKILSVLRT
ncbi:MAG: glycosyltransferase family 4 protein [Patescibacteria group bacterium]